MTAAAILMALLAAGGPKAAQAGAVEAGVAGTTDVVKGEPEGTAPAPFSEALAAELSGDERLTRFQLRLTRGVPAEVFALAGPYRVIIDLPDVGFRIPDGTGIEGRGLVRAFRYGQFAERKGRVVLDMSGPVRIENAAMTREGNDGAVVLVLDIVPTGPEEFARAAAKDAASTEIRKDASAAAVPETASTGAVSGGGAPQEPSGSPDVAGAASTGRPVVMIDPGHGGVDPGAVGQGNILEKDLTLAVARRLKARLAASGRYDVKMTRSSDVFVSLDQRVKLSRDSGAGLFISLHADSIEQEELAHTVSGATVYTLSERASDAQSQAKADKENAADLIAGLNVTDGEESDDVMNILLDLMKRETANFSADFSRTLVGQMKRAVSMSRLPRRSAAFKVLKQSHAPSVLIELGYVSNVEEAQQLASPAWQDRVSRAIATAVESYFSKRASLGP